MSATSQLSALAGTWAGEIVGGGRAVPIVLHLAADGVASTDSPTQRALGLPVECVSIRDGILSYRMPSIPAEFEGTVSADAALIDGRWSQRGQTFPLRFSRQPASIFVPAPDRPQEPQAPFPYTSENVSFISAGSDVRLGGTLTRPMGAGPFPCVILLSGSGAQDRDSTLFNHRPFLVLADFLTRRGFAVLRFDDRGVCASEGDLSRASLTDLTHDALGALHFARRRTDIDVRRTGFLGHSEGGALAVRAALATTGVAFIVSLAAPIVPGAELVVQQMRAYARLAGVSEEQTAPRVELQKRVSSLIGTAASAEAAMEACKAALLEAGLSEEVAAARVKPLSVPWVFEMLRLDLRNEFARLRIPWLALFGAHDMQVDAVANADELRALRAARPDSPDATTVVVIPDVNHLFQPSATGSLAEYRSIEVTIDPEVLKVIGDWLSRN